MPTDRRSSADGYILISGTGRAGTTLLMQYFTALGFDTGYTVEEAMAQVDPISLGGLERSLERDILPYVSKSPGFTRNFARHLDEGLRVRHLIVPMRELEAAAESRHAASRRAEEAGLDPNKQPGGRIFGGRTNPTEMRRRLAVQVFKLLQAAVSHGVPLTLLPFPEFARDHGRLWGALGPLLAEHGVTEEESIEAFARVVDIGNIHDYAPGEGARDESGTS